MVGYSAKLAFASGNEIILAHRVTCIILQQVRGANACFVTYIIHQVDLWDGGPNGILGDQTLMVGGNGVADRAAEVLTRYSSWLIMAVLVITGLLVSPSPLVSVPLHGPGDAGLSHAS